MKVFEPEYIVRYAKEHCPYYAGLYRDLPEDFRWEDIPLVDQKDYWSSNLSHLTGRQMDGQVFKSGGTTGEPKYSYYSHDEWVTFCEGTGMNLPKGGLKYGDRVENLFYGGGLYASFLYTYSMMCLSPAHVLQFSLSGNVETEEMVSTLVKHDINVMAGLPSVIMKIIDYIDRNKTEGIKLEVIYFAGETLYPEQREKIRSVLKRDIEFRSVAYASNDGGLIGYFSRDCGFNEHRACDMLCKVEIIDDETGEVITEKGRPGKLYITALYRTLMPIIRYPAGDMAEYMEDENIPDRRFKLLGRSEEAARVAYVAIYPEDVNTILRDLDIAFDTEQLILTRENNKDKLTIYIAGEPQTSRNDDIISALKAARPMLLEAEELNIICGTEVVWCSLDGLQYNKRTGKLKRIIDDRK